MAKRNEPTAQQLIGPSLLILAFVAVGAALYFMRPVLVPLVLAILISYLVTPVVDLVQVRLRVPRAIALTAALALAGGAITLLIMLISSSAASLAAKADLYQEKLVQMGNTVLALAARIGLPVNSAELEEQMADLPVGSILANVLNSVVASASVLFLVLVFVIYLVAGHSPGERREGMYGEIDRKIRRYLAVKVMMSAVTGIIVALLLALFGLELAPVFGVLAFLLNFIPSVGSIIATFLPLPLALVQFDNPFMIVLVLLIPGTFQIAIGNALEPKLMGTSLNLHPITILLSLIFWGMLWGLPGMVLAAPITAVVKIILDRVESTRPIGALLAGQLPGSPTADPSCDP